MSHSRVVFRCLLVAALALTSWISGHGQAAAEPTSKKRIALVIGNSAYKNVATLKNPTNDVEDIAVALRRLNFQVLEGRDLTKERMASKVSEFVNELPGADIALFFYAGHGIQVDGQNYLIPIEAKLPSVGAIDFEMLRLDSIQRAMEREAKATLIFLDACRDNPLARNLAGAKGTRSTSIGRGLAVMEAGVGSLISFSTQPGNIALDGQGRNSPYASALVSRLLVADQDLSEILINVRRDVMQATRNEQIPWEHSSLTRRIFFSAGIEAAAAATPQSSAAEQEAQAWAAIRDTSNPRQVQEFIRTYPNGAFLPLAKAMLTRLTKPSPAAAGKPAVAAQPSSRDNRRKRQEPATAAREAPPVARPAAIKAAPTRVASRSLDAAPRRTAAPAAKPAGSVAGGNFTAQFRAMRTACAIDGNMSACRQICAGNPYAMACNRLRGGAPRLGAMGLGAGRGMGGGGRNSFNAAFRKGRGGF